MANINSITPILKEVYTPKITDQLENYTELTKRLTKSSDNISDNFGGKYVAFPLHVGRNSGIGSRFEDETLPAAGQQKYDRGESKLRYAYGQIRLTGQSIAHSQSNPKAFAKVMTEETEGLARDLGKDFNRQLFGNGSGSLAVFTAATTGAVATVADARAVGVGDVVDIFDNLGVRSAANVKVTSVNIATRQVTFDSSTTVVVDGFMTRAGSGPDQIKGNRELTGLGAIVDDTSVLFNIDPALQPVWKSHVQAKRSGETLEDDMTLLVDTIYAAGGRTDLMVTTLGVRRAYLKELMSLRQTVNRTEHEGGFSGFKFVTDGPSGEIDVLVDVDAPKGQLQALNMNDVTLYRDKPWNWLDRDGSMWKQDFSGGGAKDAWIATMSQYHELAISRRNTHGKITSITEA